MVKADLPLKAGAEMEPNYWDMFIKSGSIQDYLAYCAHKPPFQNCREDEADEPDDQGTDSQGTEYR